jgi:hypothetical protein
MNFPKAYDYRELKAMAIDLLYLEVGWQ